MSSITLVSVPRTSVSIPSPAIASLKSILEKNYHSACCIDLNVELYYQIDYKSYIEIDNYFQIDLRYFSNTDILEAFSYHKEKLSLDSCTEYDTFLEKWSKNILEKQNDWIGISLLSVNSIISCFDLCKSLKSLDPDCKIVIGGPGVSTSGIMGTANFGELLKRYKFIDEYIQGEGEEKIVDLLNGARRKEYKQIENLDALPIPNYDDFNLNLYDNHNNLISVTGSRGCVRNCSFCDIKSAWKRYRFRSGKNITDEIIYYYQKYNTTHIQFTDSLINGSLKSFGDFLDSMIEAKKNNLLDANITWSGQFICRPKNQFPEEWYKKMSAAGVGQLYIGVESGSESVLNDMGKKLSYSDMIFMMDMLMKYEIQCDLLLIVGYPTETEKDFQKTLDMITEFSKYNEAGIISGVNLGKTMVVLPGSPIGKNLGHWGIEYDTNNNWISKLNPSLNFRERVRRRLEIQKLCEEYGYIVRWPLTTLKTVKDGVMNNKETI